MEHLTLFDRHGSPVKKLAMRELTTPSGEPAKTRKNHLIFVVDRSGSQYCDIPAIHSSLRASLTIQEYKNSDLFVSLCSTSSQGDITTHFDHIAISEIMKPGSPYLEEVSKIRASCLTNLSQGLVRARQLVRSDETTGIVFMSDGWANDPGPSFEAKAIESEVALLKKVPGLFCTTVGFRSSCDFMTLGKIASELSGRCLQAPDSRALQNAFEESVARMAKDSPRTLELRASDEANSVLFWSSSGQVAMGYGQVSVSGIAPSDKVHAFELVPVDKSGEPFNASDAVAAYSLACLQAGDINEAKTGLFSIGSDFARPYYRAMTAPDLADMASALTRVIASPMPASTSRFGVPSTGPTLNEVIDVLSAHRGIVVDLEALGKVYKPVGVKRVPGKRVPGSDEVVPPDFDLAPAEKGRGILGPFMSPRQNASVNVQVTIPSFLVGRDGVTVPSVSGISLNGLTAYRTFQVKSDGASALRVLPIISPDKKLRGELSRLGVLLEVPADAPPHSMRVNLDLDISADEPVSPSRDVVDVLLSLTTVQKLLEAMLKGESDTYPPEVVAELSRHHLSEALYFSPPTVNAYVGEAKNAAARGEIDYRTSYKVALGTEAVTAATKLKGGNAYLQRRFTAKDAAGETIAKPTCPMLLDPTVVWEYKDTKRMKLDGVDELMFPIFEAFVAMAGGSPAKTAPGFDKDMSVTVHAAMASRAPSKQTGVDLLTSLLGEVNDAIDSAYKRFVQPIVMFVGSSGQVPRSLNVAPVKADSLKSLSGDERDTGSFYVTHDGVLLSIFSESVPYTVRA